jgi:hypothetical protein
MLATLDRRVAVVLFSNTSGGSAESKAFIEIYGALIAYGLARKR